MRTPKINLWKYHKSLYNTQKVKRTISQNKPYLQKVKKQETEMEQELLADFEKRKKLEAELTEKLNNSFIELQAQDISFKVLLLYGIKIDKEKIIEILKARKAK